MTAYISKQQYPRQSPEGFLERAFMWLNSGIDMGLFYAGLELRCCFEKIWLKHGIASNDESDEFTKLNWKPRQIQRRLSNELSPDIDINQSYIFTHDAANPSLTTGYYLAMPDTLLLGSKGLLNDFVHAQWAIPINTPDKAWYLENHKLLSRVANDLVPHVNPRNSLVLACMPDIKACPTDSAVVEGILRVGMTHIIRAGAP
jgi:hypothetical protein